LREYVLCYQGARTTYGVWIACVLGTYEGDLGGHQHEARVPCDEQPVTADPAVSSLRLLVSNMK